MENVVFQNDIVKANHNSTTETDIHPANYTKF